MQDRRIGFLFPKISKAGKKYFSGKVTINGEEHEIVSFYAKSKAGVDYLSISLSTPREEHSEKSTPEAPRAYQKPQVDANRIEPDDLPF